MTISTDLLDIDTIEYPEEDDLPMAEGDAQREYLSYATKVLRIFFQARQDVYVSGNLLIYYEKGNKEACIAPDTFVVFGVDNRDRGSYKVWEENNTVPAFVLEITSASTVARDQRNKPELYQKLGVKEYFQYDPTGKYLKTSSLQGQRLKRGRYVDIDASNLPNGALCLFSQTLNLELRLYPNKGLRFYDPVTGELLRSHEEETEARVLAEQITQQERQARLTEQQRVDRLEAHLRSLGINPDEVV
jgi:Uma2 family endonuclease